MLKDESINQDPFVEEGIRLLEERFVSRSDVYAVQRVRKGRVFYRPVREPLDAAVLRDHLLGKITIAVYPGQETNKWLCIDIDSRDESVVKDVLVKMREKGLVPLIEFSGCKGYHLWVFFDEPLEDGRAKALGDAITQEHEVFPKQERIESGKLGSPIKLPLGVHVLSGVRCHFVDQNLKPCTDQLAALREAGRHDGEALFETIERKPRDTEAGEAESHDVKPCVKRLIQNGVAKGKRNRAGHIIACECRQAGFSLPETRGVLRTWNLRNRPPLTVGEIKALLVSAFHNQYDYGCKLYGPLRKVVQCPGPDNCSYYQRFIHKQRKAKEEKTT